MKEIKIIENEAHTTKEKIMKFANSIKVKLPDKYISFLLEHNGGQPENNIFDLIEPINNFEKSSSVEWFFALYNGKYNNLERSYIEYKGTEFFPIACTSGNNQVCLCIEGKNYGKVYYWDYIASGEETPTYDNIYLIANNFTDFINNLYKLDIEEDENGKDLWVSTHDKYSLPTSFHIRNHGKAITDFFDKAPKEVEKFIIKEFTANGDLLLSFKSGDREYFRRLNKDGKIIEET